MAIDLKKIGLNDHFNDEAAQYKGLFIARVSSSTVNNTR